MTIDLSIKSKPNDNPRAQRFEEQIVTIGRDASSTLRFDMAADLEVSTRHAEIRREDDAYVIVDNDSTNGTWVNGTRISRTRVLNPGDVVRLGRNGPELRVDAVDDDKWHQTVESKAPRSPLRAHPLWRPQRTREFLVHHIETQTRSLKMAVAGAVTGILILGIIGWLYVRAMPAEDPQVWREVTAPAIRKANDDAVVLIETEIPGTSCYRGCEGTGFGINTDGLVVTNRHVVVQRGVRAATIRVKFANTRAWLATHIVRVAGDPTADLALLKVDERGRYPAVVGVSANGVDLPVGSDVMTIGFPLGTALRMEGAGAGAVAKTTMTTGSIGKVLSGVFQIDAFGDHGSSGSPVFDRHGHAIGVVSGGARNESDKILYVVPANLIWELTQAAGLAATQ